MTLVEEKPQHSAWANFSYKELLKALLKLGINKNKNTSSSIICEYVKSLTKLTQIADKFISNPSLFPNVFTQGHLSKLAKINKIYSNEYQKFISENQLETILQKAFYTKALGLIREDDVDYEISDTRGVALLNAFFTKKILLNGIYFKTGIQFQGNTFKFALTVYDDYKNSKKDWVVPFFDVFNKLANDKINGYVKINKPDTKSWLSVSKKMEIEFYKLQLQDYAELFKGELRNARDMTHLVLEYIK